MPYIDKRARERLNASGAAITPGELNFVITDVILDYLPQTPSYRDYNEVVGVLECVKLELYRRMAAPYEDMKRRENGDVYRQAAELGHR